MPRLVQLLNQKSTLIWGGGSVLFSLYIAWVGSIKPIIPPFDESSEQYAINEQFTDVLLKIPSYRLTDEDAARDLLRRFDSPSALNAWGEQEKRQPEFKAKLDVNGFTDIQPIPDSQVFHNIQPLHQSEIDRRHSQMHELVANFRVNPVRRAILTAVTSLLVLLIAIPILLLVQQRAIRPAIIWLWQSLLKLINQLSLAMQGKYQP